MLPKLMMDALRPNRNSVWLTNFMEKAMHLKVNNHWNPLPMLIQKDAHPENQQHTWAPRLGEALSMHARPHRTRSMDNVLETMQLAKAMFLGIEAGTEEIGGRLIGVQMDPSIDEEDVREISEHARIKILRR